MKKLPATTLNGFISVAVASIGVVAMAMSPQFNDSWVTDAGLVATVVGTEVGLVYCTSLVPE